LLLGLAAITTAAGNPHPLLDLLTLLDDYLFALFLFLLGLMIIILIAAASSDLHNKVVSIILIVGSSKSLLLFEAHLSQLLAGHLLISLEMLGKGILHLGEVRILVGQSCRIVLLLHDFQGRGILWRI
jgi:hypothetical protein